MIEGEVLRRYGCLSAKSPPIRSARPALLAQSLRGWSFWC